MSRICLNLLKVKCSPGETVCGHCPSVEVMMQSVASQAGSNAVGVMLTGMGADGADGMLAMRQAGAKTVSQDEQTSVVYGMPKEAWIRGGSERQLPLPQIGPEVVNIIKSMPIT